MSSPRGPQPLVPLLPLMDGRVDPDILATWHLALSNALAPDLPHDLFAIWLYTPAGPVLLAPEALAADALTPPPARPHVDAVALDAFAQIFVAARYQSTICQPVAYGRSDVALLVVADLRPGLDSPERRALLLQAARVLAPSLARLARDWNSEPLDPTIVTRDDVAGLLLALSRASVSEPSVAGVLRSLLAVMAQWIPFDAAELIVPGAARDAWLRLTVHTHGSLWQQRDLLIGGETLARLRIDQAGAEAYVPELDGAEEWAELMPLAASPPVSAAVVPLVLEGRTVGRLVMTSGDRDLYGTRELRLLTDVAPFLAARVEALVRSADLAESRARAASLQAVPTQLHRLTTILATTTDTPAALRDVVAEATALLPFHRVRFAIRLAAPDRVAFALPGEARPFADLPQTPIGNTPLEAVLLGQRPHAAADGGGDREWIFPLRVSGETIGALLLAMESGDRLSNVQLALAQQLADIVAPYLELRRRPYARTPFAVGWKRSPSIPES